MMRRHRAESDLVLYTRAAQRSSARIIREYSTSFGMATGLLDRYNRPDIENLYGLVRIADEIVDGAAAQAGLDAPAQLALLDALEAETERAIGTGYSTNVVVHSFAETARAVQIGPELIAPFFASMRRDLDPAPFTREQVSDYIYGSAEVVGLMCLRVFLTDAAREYDAGERARLEAGARALGAAFQKVNFLRDLAADAGTLGRSYFPGIDVAALTDQQKTALVDEIDADLDAAAATLRLLPPSSRKAVALAHGLFAELSRRIRRTPASTLIHTRVRVPESVKLRIAARAALGRTA
jgi:phytoene/squalene synthetase